MDFGGLDDILDDDIGYVPTAIKRQQKPRGRPASMSRQNSTQSIGSLKDTKQDQPKINFGNSRQNQNSLKLNKQSPKNSQFSLDQQLIRQPVRRNTLFGAHKQTSIIAQNSNNSQGPISFEDFFKNQGNINTLGRPPLPDSKPPLPQRKIQKNSSFSHLSSPENIIDDDLNNSSMASRRGRPPLNRKNQNISNEDQIQQNRSQNFVSSKGFSNLNETPMTQGSNLNSRPAVQKRQQTNFPTISISQNQASLVPVSSMNQTLMNESIQELKKVFTSQLQYQKKAFQVLIKQQRQSHSQQVKKLRQFNGQEIKKKLQIKDFEIQKIKQFYELQLKIYKQRQLQIKDYSSIARKLEGNIETIQKMQKNMKENEIKGRKQKQDQKKQNIQKKQTDIKQRQIQLNLQFTQLQEQRQQLKNDKISLTQSINSQKARLYELQVDLRKRQAQLQVKYKKLELKLAQQYEFKSKQIEKEREQLRMESLQLKQQRNLIQIEKIEVINSRKLWDNQKKSYLQSLHQQKTKVIEKQIQIASRTGQLEIKQQEIQMNQNDYINKLKLIELQKKKMQIEKNTAKGQLYLNATSGTLKTHGLLGTSLLNKTSQSALQKQFYSNDEFQNEGFQQESNYKKSITQMRDEFLKSLPRF